MKLTILLILSITNLFSNTENFKSSLLEIKITTQTPNFIYPWQTKKPTTSDAIGIVISENRILALTSSLEYSTSIEIKKPNGTTVPANTVKKDNESNLTILTVEDKSFFKDLKPVEFETSFSVNSQIQILQHGDSGSIQNSKAYTTGLDQEIYPISYTRLPFIKINSNEKLEGFGELVLEKGKPIGILYKFTSNKNFGKVIPGFLINQFLKNKTQNPTFPFKGFKFKQLTDSASREFYGVPKNIEGVLVTEIFQNSSASGKLKLNDVLTEIAGQKIDSNGYFNHPKFGKQLLSLIAHTENEFGFKIGSFLPVKIIRDKKEMEIKLRLKSFPYQSVKIPYSNFHGEEPKYLIASGFIFTELSEFLLKEFGNNWRGRVDKKLLYLNDYHRYQKDGEKGRYILLIQVFPDVANNGYHSLSFDLVKSVNGKKSTSLVEIDSALRSKDDSQFVDIELENSVNIVIDKLKLDEIDKRIREKFGIEALKNF
jgi:hypothetical protein